VHYLCKLLTYGHQICTVGAPDMCAPTDRFTLLWPTFQGHWSRCKSPILGKLGISIYNRPTDEPWSQTKR